MSDSRRIPAGARRTGRRPWVAVAPAALLLGLVLPTATGAQSAPAFTGRYRFVLTVSPSCPPAMQVGPLSIVMNVEETTLDGVTEVAGQSASPHEVPDNGRFVLLRQGSHLHGAFGGHSQYVGLETEGIYRVWMQVMTDGTAGVASGGRARATGTAFGEVEIGLTSDPVGNPIPDGNCGLTTNGHRWSLEPA